MKVINIDYENKIFETDNGETFPLMFDIDKSENAIKRSIEHRKKIKKYVGSKR